MRPRWIQVGAESAAAAEFRRALSWWRAALENRVAVPLAPRLVFPQVGEPGCLFVFTDAAREKGTCFGGFTTIEEGARREKTFLFVEQRWSTGTLERLQRDEWSMPAGEMVWSRDDCVGSGAEVEESDPRNLLLGQRRDGECSDDGE